MESFLDRLLTDVADTRVRVGESPATDEPGGGPERTRETPGAASPPEAATDQPAPSDTTPVPRTGLGGEGLPAAPAGSAAPRIAIYDTLTSPPRVVAVEEEDLPALIASLAEKTYHHCREQGGQVPYTVIQELIENLLHAYFRDVVVTILDNGQTLRISDHGPGLDDKERAFQPGFTTATPTQRQVIRGVGSGLPIARESLQFLRGLLTVEDNLGGGAVFTIRLPQRQQTAPAEPPAAPLPRLTTRQKKVLVLLMELGAAGPTQVGREIGVAPSTAFRELGLLEQMGLIHSLGDGKRALREEGLRLLDTLV
jgi:anti-sigma regulatory factor (Ser/Thr protein kinase)